MSDVVLVVALWFALLWLGTIAWARICDQVAHRAGASPGSDRWLRQYLLGRWYEQHLADRLLVGVYPLVMVVAGGLALALFVSGGWPR